MSLKATGILKGIINDRKMIFSLAKNDFKTKYAGSYLGIVWAFVQPIVTVLVYWFVFQVAFHSQPVDDFPFVLWLIAGLVPWFFFQDSWNGGTQAFVDYSYLVKKVVFNISIIPLVKVISALFVHMAFLAFMLVIYVGYGNMPNLYWLQIPYYTLALFFLALALSYITSSLLVFFRDLSQIITIILQVGVWLTPIMWNVNSLGLPKPVKIVIMLNPLYYIVNGYRESLIYKTAFFENMGMTLYFWAVVAVLMVLGLWMFGKLRIHFADVL